MHINVLSDVILALFRSHPKIEYLIWNYKIPSEKRVSARQNYYMHYAISILIL